MPSCLRAWPVSFRGLVAAVEVWLPCRRPVYFTCSSPRRCCSSSLAKPGFLRPCLGPRRGPGVRPTASAKAPSQRAQAFPMRCDDSSSQLGVSATVLGWRAVTGCAGPGGNALSGRGQGSTARHSRNGIRGDRGGAAAELRGLRKWSWGGAGKRRPLMNRQMGLQGARGCGQWSAGKIWTQPVRSCAGAEPAQVSSGWAACTLSRQPRARCTRRGT